MLTIYYLISKTVKMRLKIELPYMYNYQIEYNLPEALMFPQFFRRSHLFLAISGSLSLKS